ncbi:hypothetical protein D3C85_923510 [compost metagenome]
MRMNDERIERGENGQAAILIPDWLQATLRTYRLDLRARLGLEGQIPSALVHMLIGRAIGSAFRGEVHGCPSTHPLDFRDEFRRHIVDQIAHVTNHGFAADSGGLAGKEGNALWVITAVCHFRMQPQLDFGCQPGGFHDPCADRGARRAAAGIAPLKFGICRNE